MKFKFITQLVPLFEIVLRSNLAFSGDSVSDDLSEKCYEYLDACSQLFCITPFSQSLRAVDVVLPVVQQSYHAVEKSQEISTLLSELETKLSDLQDNSLPEKLAPSSISELENWRQYYKTEIHGFQILPRSLPSLLSQSPEIISGVESRQRALEEKLAEVEGKIEAYEDIASLHKQRLERINQITLEWFRLSSINDKMKEIPKIAEFVKNLPSKISTSNSKPNIFIRLAETIGAEPASKIVDMSKLVFKFDHKGRMNRDGNPKKRYEDKFFENHPERLLVSWNARVLVLDTDGRVRIQEAKFFIQRQHSWDNFKYRFGWNLSLSPDVKLDVEKIKKIHRKYTDSSNIVSNSNIRGTLLGIPSEIETGDLARLTELLGFIYERLGSIE